MDRTAALYRTVGSIAIRALQRGGMSVPTECGGASPPKSGGTTNAPFALSRLTQGVLLCKGVMARAKCGQGTKVGRCPTPRFRA